MSKVHVFNAGPCLLPSKVYDEAAEAIKDFAGTGISVLSVSHRTKEWENVMNVCFVMNAGFEGLESEFLAFAKDRQIVGIKGHRSVGGFRASVYNACSKEDVQALVNAMQEFEHLRK